MKLIFTGRGKSGSWEIRGNQLGVAVGANVALNSDGAGFDLAVVVKRMNVRPVVPFVYDVVDAHPQPASDKWSRQASIQWMASHIGHINPMAIVAATQTMERDCAALGLPTMTLPHHARPCQEMNPIREQIHSVGYEGSLKHLGWWQDIVQRECNKRHWRFVINPLALADVDIVVALRASEGYPARHWKSNVKLANAQATGTPAVLTLEQGYLETQSGAESFVEDERGVGMAFDRYEDWHERQSAARTMLLVAPRLETLAAQYKTWLRELHAKWS